MENQYESDTGVIVVDDENQWSPNQIKFKTKGGPQSIAVSSKNLYNIVTQQHREDEVGPLRQKYAEDTSGTKYSQNDGSNNYYQNSNVKLNNVNNAQSVTHLIDQQKIKSHDNMMSGGEGSEIFNMS